MAISDTEVFAKEEYCNKIEEYNTCVDTCQKDLKQFRYDCEFQMREF